MIRINELHVKAPGRNQEDGNDLGRQLSERLAESLPEPSGNVHIPEIRIRLQIASLDDTRQAADQIAEQIIRKIGIESFRL